MIPSLGRRLSSIACGPLSRSSSPSLWSFAPRPISSPTLVRDPSQISIVGTRSYFDDLLTGIKKKNMPPNEGFHHIRKIYCEERKVTGKAGVALLRKADYIPSIINGGGKEPILLQIEQGRMIGLLQKRELKEEHRYLLLIDRGDGVVQEQIAKLKQLTQHHLHETPLRAVFSRTDDPPSILEGPLPTKYKRLKKRVRTQKFVPNSRKRVIEEKERRKAVVGSRVVFN
eukprot:TRINITY_DN2507_c0_g1_i2.p1 TRINITY_DN2507_c0_g1~~TRINITY_DN2507_c0_g1_i2.p1  ORF type:complete len:228 (-),score=51.96 TRINITY_DN2507_c0_g1_i2:106-789(-)